jgi:tellurite methyltransferase
MPTAEILAAPRRVVDASRNKGARVLSEDRDVPSAIDTKAAVDAELDRWNRIYAGEDYYYGSDPGPVARRAVRYHRAYLPEGGTALDAGCGEGQDLAFLAESGYQAVGLELTPEGVRKSSRLLERRALRAEIVAQDLRDLDRSRRYDLVLAVNSLQFMGPDASLCLDRLIEAAAPGGVMGLSLFAREPGQPEVAGTLWFTTLEELLARFEGWQPLEAARLWQWNVRTNEPQPFVTLVARKTPPSRRLVGIDSRFR